MLRQSDNQCDDSIRSTLQAILNVTLTDDGWHQASANMAVSVCSVHQT